MILKLCIWGGFSLAIVCVALVVVFLVLWWIKAAIYSAAGAVFLFFVSNRESRALQEDERWRKAYEPTPKL